MNKPLDKMTFKELVEYAEKDPGYALCRYVDERRAQEKGMPPPDRTPYDAKVEHGEGVQGPR